MEKKKIEEEKEKKGKKKWLLLLLLLLLFVFVSIGVTYSVNEEFKDSIDETIINTFKVDTPTAPMIEGNSKEWSRKEIVKVVKDAKSYSEIGYYEYCMVDSKDFSNCEWHKTETKNMVASTTGKYYVVFRGISKNGKTGKNSNIEEVLIDNEGPTVSKLEITNLKSNKVEVYIEAKDNHSGIGSYYYKIDNGEYQKVEKTFNIENLEEKEYTITIKVEDKLGNYKEVSKVFLYNNEICQLNCDTDGDGKADTNIDTDGDGVCDLNCGDTQENTPSVTPAPSISPNPSMSPTPSDNPILDEEEIDDMVPEINLDKVPAEFLYGKDYDLPSYYKFGPSGGTVECKVDGEVSTSTKTLNVGTHNIVCVARGNNGISVRVSKKVEVKVEIGLDEEWDGWIRLNLYYPENSTEWQWRLGKENEIRDGYENTGWQDYTGPILVKLSDVENVYIRYKMNGETYIIAPKGKLAVDIEPDKYTLNSSEKTTVNIYYDKDAIIKEYRIGNGEWQEYKEPFEVGINTLIEARGTKEEKVYDSDGNYVYTSKITGVDSVFISEYITSSGENEGGESSGGGSSSGGSGTTPGGSGGSISYEPGTTPDGDSITKPSFGSKPSTYLVGPEIQANPSTELTESVEITVVPQEEAETIYISVGNNSYTEYTNSIHVGKNTTVKAYYIRKSDGKISDVSYYQVKNIKTGNKPYVRIDVEPDNYLSDIQKQVVVAISGSNYDKLEYSFDGEIYSEYTNFLTITESKTVYARAINSYGITVEKTVITTTTPSILKGNLDISIYANPSSSNQLINKTMVTIDYDQNATKRYYKLAGEIDYKEYTGPFEITNNTTVYAYATGENKEGKASKGIDFLTTGIMAPIITVTPTETSNMVTVSITFDKNAKKQYYSINNEEELYYTGPFEVYENSDIYAYNSNILGYEADSTYEITNIKQLPKYIAIDKEKYFIIKLNYPEESKLREYKWKPDGTWKEYDEKGILLIKPDYKDEFDFDSYDGIEVEDENGKKVIFTDHYYLIDVAFSKLMENLFMRWDVSKPTAPQIIVTPSDEATQKVEVGIFYPSSLVKKYYKVVTPSGEDSGWLTYDGVFTVKENNSIVYAKGETFSEVESKVASIQITNIDEVAPTIQVNGDFETPKQQVTLTVEAIDNMKMHIVMWAKGEKTKEYFKEKGETISNPGIFTVSENGKYTIYAKDYAGNESIKVVEVTNIDKTAPNVIIHVLTEKLSSKVEVSIDYGDSSVKEYRIGNVGNYSTYTDNLEISSYDVVDLQNEDGSLTIYARGTDDAGNITEVSEKIYMLDLDIPNSPVIYANEGYPTLTKYGMIEETESYIVYDTTRDDVDNYYRIDNEDWALYTGPIKIKEGVIEAKSVKTVSGVEVTSSSQVVVPTDAVSKETYDNNLETSSTITKNTTRKFTVLSNLMNEDIKFYISGTVASDASVSIYDEEGILLNKKSITSPITLLRVPVDGYKVEIYAGSSNLILKEITLRDEKTLVDKTLLPVISLDNANWAIEKVVNIKYPEGEYNNQYSLDNGETWEEYESPFKLEKPMTVIARVVKNDEVVSASSYVVSKIDPDKPIVEINISSGIQLGYSQELPTYYKIGKSGGSVECIDETKNTVVTNTNELKIGTHEIVCTVKNNAGNKATAKKTIKVSDVSEYQGDSILDILARDDIVAGTYNLQVNDEIYSAHVYVLDGNQEWTTNQTFGDSDDVATASTYAQNMVIVKVNGDVTISSGVTVGPYYNTYGGPKGFTLYVTGTLTNNGTIDNSHGAKAVGQNVYLWKNADGTYEYVPAAGANASTNGINRQTGGGASGVNGGSGSAGTSYSGGSGGGAGYVYKGTAGKPNGGAGGNGDTSNAAVSGGAGNPGGLPKRGGQSGGNGTGGLLTIYANNYKNNGIISAIGSNGGSGSNAGGNSGGGSINIFTNQSTGIDKLGIITNTRYNEIKGTTSNSGGTVKKIAGSGDISIGEIRNGQYYDLKTIIEQDKAAYKNSVTIEGDSILSILSKNDLKSGYWFFKVNNEEYSVHLYVFEGSQEWTTNQTFGDAIDVATASTYAQNMVIVKVNGDVTIASGVTVGPYYDTNYGGPKGFTLYVTGTLMNNGTVDNSHGAKAVGQNVYLWKNTDGTYEYVPATGGAANTSGSGRQTGGGGTGGSTAGRPGSGSVGTSYSGGTGGGGSYVNQAASGTANGGAGGAAATSNGAASGGAGNPGGSGARGASGSNGTGGLLTIYADSYQNKGRITVNGSNGGLSGVRGGGSGGGSINIFYSSSYIAGTATRSGGANRAGSGTVTYTQLNAVSIGSKNYYSNFDGNTLVDEYSMVTINFFNTVGDNLYSIDDGNTWLSYTEPFKVAPNTKVIAKATSVLGNIVESSYTTTSLTDNISKDAFDSNQETKVVVSSGNKVNFTVSNNLVNQKLRFYVSNTPASDATIKVYDSKNTELESISITNPVTVLTIPDNSYLITVSSGSSDLEITEISLRDKISVLIETPTISVDNVEWSTSKTVTISYPEGYTNEYSLDYGSTWDTYLSPIIVDKESIVIARVVDKDGKVVSSSSYKVTKIDTTEPSITLDIPDEITVEEEYSLPSSYTVDNTKSGGSAICKINDTEVTNTSTLDLGTYEITCTATTGAGKSNSVSKTITVKDIPVDITLDIPDRILVGESFNLPTSVTGGSSTCKIGEEEINNTSSLEVGTYDILCTVTSNHGTTKNVSKQIEIYEELIEENNGESEVTENEVTE